jgi:Trypsin-like peptidase domain
VSEDSYWVSISRDDTRLGAGFMLTGCYVLTAHHCLGDDVPGAEDVKVEFEGGQVLAGRVLRRSPRADLALIDVPELGYGPIIPRATPASTGEAWRNPYRPSLSDALLSGTIEAVPVTFQCVGGDVVEALQLGCVQDLGDYAGYSGSPIEGGGPDGDSRLFGVLIEQYPQRSPDHAGPGPASMVLFAVTLAEVFRRFDCFDVGHLMRLLPSSARADAPEVREEIDRPAALADTRSRIAVANAEIEALDSWQQRGLLNEQDVTALKLKVIKRRLLGDEPGDQS